VTVTVTGFVTGGAELRCKRRFALTDRLRLTTAMYSIVTVGMGMQCCTTVPVLLVFESEGPVFYALIHLIRAIRRDRNLLKHLGRGVDQHP